MEVFLFSQNSFLKYFSTVNGIFQTFTHVEKCLLNTKCVSGTVGDGNRKVKKTLVLKHSLYTGQMGKCSLNVN